MSSVNTKGRKSKRVAVLRGGPGAYHESLESGLHIIRNLRPRHEVVDVLIDRDGVWHVGGLPIQPHKALERADVVWNALHGYYGEDGQVQDLLERLQHNYTGSGRIVSAIGYNKHLSKEVFRKAGLRVPEGVQVTMRQDPYEVADQLFKTIGGQYVVKPLRGCGSEGVRVVRTQSDLVDAIIQSLWSYDEIVVEELVRGKEVKIGVVDGLRGEEHYILLPVEIIKDGQTNAYLPLGGNNFRIPGNFSSEEKQALSETAKLAHLALGARGYSMSDIVITSRGPVVIEVDTHPFLAQGLPFHDGLMALGVAQVEFVEHIINYL